MLGLLGTGEDSGCILGLRLAVTVQRLRLGKLVPMHTTILKEPSASVAKYY